MAVALPGPQMSGQAHQPTIDFAYPCVPLAFRRNFPLHHYLPFCHFAGGGCRRFTRTQVLLWAWASAKTRLHLAFDQITIVPRKQTPRRSGSCHVPAACHAPFCCDRWACDHPLKLKTRRHDSFSERKTTPVPSLSATTAKRQRWHETTL